MSTTPFLRDGACGKVLQAQVDQTEILERRWDKISTLHTSEKTNPGMPPQSQALESVSADNRKGKDETGCGRRGNTTTGVQHGREDRFLELTSPRNSHTATPEQSERAEARGVIAPPSSTASRVFVLDKHGNPLMPCHPARARKLLKSGRARVHRLAPFVIRIVDREIEQCEVPGVVVKIDPGSKHTGIACARVDEAGITHGLVSIQLDHRGQFIHEKMEQRARYRRRRRSVNLRYRAPRWRNRHPQACRACGKNAKHNKGYCGPCIQKRDFVDNGYRQYRLPPSLFHRVTTTTSWVNRLSRWAPVTSLSMELVRFDTQAMQNPEISGVEYQQGTLAGYEVREYLLEKWNRKCAYCETSGTPLNIDHIVARSRGGTNRISNLTLSCRDCNESKGSEDVETWCERHFRRQNGRKIANKVTAQAKALLKDTAAVNSTRWALWRELLKAGLPVETGTGGRTKWNRKRFGVPKSHTLDALCIGNIDSIGSVPNNILIVACIGRGKHQRTTLNKYGFVRSRLPRTKTHHGLRTGDFVRAAVPNGKYKGVHVGRVSIRSSGRVCVSKVDGISYKNCSVLQRADGYGYSREKEALLIPAQEVGVSKAR